ncbi:MAG: hypothetical protein ACLUD1_01630 [Clostridia bacterium]
MGRKSKIDARTKKMGDEQNIFKNSVIYGIAQDGTDTPPENVDMMCVL